MRTIPLPTALMRAGLALPLVVAISAAVPASADHRESGPSQLAVQYEVTELESLAGGASAAASINNRGWVAGDTSVPDEGVLHATLWRNGSATDLGTLGGPGTNSAVLWPNKNHSFVVGVAETDEIDENGELWSCSAFFGNVTGHACVGFVWEDGQMRELPTYEGGTHGFATGANNRGLVVGWAETGERDPSCAGSEGRNQVLGFVGAVWDTRNGDTIRELPPLPDKDDSASTGNAINDRGQVVGISGACDQAFGRFSARHMAIWNDGVPTEIPSFGAPAWNTPMAINNSGVVVGFANAADTDPVGAFNGQPFIWSERRGTDPLDVLDGGTGGQALGINDRGQAVGLSSGDDGPTAVTWLDEEVVDLNDVTPGYEGHLQVASDINDAGVISGRAVSETGETVAVIATPVDD